MRRARWALIGRALLVLALVGAGCRGEGPDWRITQLYGGPGSVQALTEPVTVEAYRISPIARVPEAGVAYVGLHEVTAGPVHVPAETAAELSEILANPDTYDWHHTKGDLFQPTIGLRFTRDVSRVDVALDFVSSNMLTIHRHGKRIGVEDFDDARPRLLAIVKSLFPDDARVQSID